MTLPDDFCEYIMRDLASLSGLVLFRVTGTWANKGREGEIDSIVLAKDAIEAASRAWEVEDNRDLRTLHVEWLCPVESVLKISEIEALGSSQGNVILKGDT